MNTPAHLILGMAAFSRPNAPAVNVAILTGSLLPDLSLYLLGAVALFINDISPSIVFGEMYFSESWQRIFSVDNSFFVWLAVALAGLWFRRDWLLALGIAALLHLLTDFPLHHDDGRAHFWPLSDWIFRSPVSYWDPDHYGRIFGVLEGLLCFGLAAIMMFRFRTILARTMIAGLAAVELLPLGVGTLISGFGS